MRGSPLLRTLLILAALIVSGIGIARLTHKGTSVSAGQTEQIPVKSEGDRIPAQFYLTLSHLSDFSALTVGEVNVPLLRGERGKLSGTALIDPANPVVFLKVFCLTKAPHDGQRIFAKLVVEAAGEETFSHVFDAEGDIEDFVELPF